MPEIFLIVVILLFVANLVLIAFAIMDLMQREKVKLFSKTGWIIFIAFVLFGSVIYFLFGQGDGTELETTGK